ncbi:hypothetical protein Y032_0007g3390 [Ancylostoma ceylanicum]|uniref:Uncharacterized protein n=1 Tax=Ancylostoma ceylanicum TaxID=53326 RepID=A0A016VMA5_9BILA|nr:hypothetical protein Y032_0007g3390 [Ancylostoma ceylanicum]
MAGSVPNIMCSGTLGSNMIYLNDINNTRYEIKEWKSAGGVGVSSMAIKPGSGRSPEGAVRDCRMALKGLGRS